MATFKVGQRVRLARQLWGFAFFGVLVGEEGVITEGLHDHTSNSDNVTRQCYSVLFAKWSTLVECSPDELEPLDKPKELTVESELERIFESVRETEHA